MHPEALRQMVLQHNTETRTRIQEDRLAWRLLHTRRSQRHGSAAAAYDSYEIPAIPDYVDGSFMASAHGRVSVPSQVGASGQADSAAGHVPAARDAA